MHGPVERRQITLALGARTVGCAHADRWPLEVLEELLGQRLLAELRFRRGLTYAPWAYNVFQRDSGYFAAQVTVADRHEEWARDTLLGEIDELTQAAPKRRAVRSAARLVWANWAAADENNAERAATLADPILDWPADQAPPDIEAELAAVTPADIHRVVRAYFVPERRFLGRHTPIFALDNLVAGFEDRLQDAKRLALLGLGAAAVHLIWQRLARPGEAVEQHGNRRSEIHHRQYSQDARCASHARRIPNHARQTSAPSRVPRPTRPSAPSRLPSGHARPHRNPNASRITRKSSRSPIPRPGCRRPGASKPSTSCMRS